jgi:hypothetical protein
LGTNWQFVKNTFSFFHSILSIFHILKMTDYKANTPFRSLYPASLPASNDAVTISDNFYLQRKSTERVYHFKPTIWGESGDNLNVNTDKLRHRPSDIMDHMNRARPLPSMNIS